MRSHMKAITNGIQSEIANYKIQWVLTSNNGNATHDVSVEAEQL